VRVGDLLIDIPAMAEAAKQLKIRKTFAVLTVISVFACVQELGIGEMSESSAYYIYSAG